MKRSLNLFILAIFACFTQMCAADMTEETYSEDSYGFKIYGDYLYWKVVQDQMHYAALLSREAKGMVNETEAENLSVIDPSFDYKSGFRVGVGYTVPCSNWDFELVWTSIHEKSSSHITDSDRGIIPLAVPVSALFRFLNGDPMLFGFANEGTSRWKFEFDVIDLQVGKTCSCFDTVKMRSYIGVKFASIQQSQHIHYVGFVLDTTTFFLQSMKKNHFHGVGPSFGVDAAWEFYPQFSLVSGIGGALLYGKFDVTTTPMLSEEQNSIAISLHNSKKSRLRPCVDANIGVNWNSSICDRFPIQIGVAYEAQYWWNQWQAPVSAISLITSGTPPQGDLMMYGLTVNAMIGF